MNYEYLGHRRTQCEATSVATELSNVDADGTTRDIILSIMLSKLYFITRINKRTLTRITTDAWFSFDFCSVPSSYNCVLFTLPLVCLVAVGI